MLDRQVCKGRNQAKRFALHALHAATLGTGIGSSIMGIALMFGMLVTPYAEEAFALLG